MIDLATQPVRVKATYLAVAVRNVRLRTAAKLKLPVHTVADAAVPAVRKAFLKAVAGLNPSNAKAFEKALAARLSELLVPVLQRVVVLSGQAHAMTLRMAGAEPGHPFYGNQHTSVSVDHFTGTQKYKLSEKASQLAESDEFVWENDLLPSLDGLRPAGFSDGDQARKKGAEDKLSHLVKKHGLSGRVVTIRDGQKVTGLATISSKYENHPERPAFEKAVSRYFGGKGLDEQQERLIGKWLGFPAKSVEKFLVNKSKLRTGEDFRAAKLPAKVGKVKLGMKFDVKNPRAIAWAKQHAAELARDLAKESVLAVRAVVSSGIANGRTITKTAKLLQAVVGLTERQGLAIVSLQEKLELEGLSDQDIQDEVFARSQEYIESRADVIAHTETMRASNEGQQELWEQAVDEGLLTGNELKEWIVTPDDRLCPICEAMDGQTTELDGEFDVDGEAVSVPPAHPNCRCTIGLSAQRAS